MSSKKEESLYKILGTTAKISDKRIKEKYIQAVRKHPPETDPEGFEKVRYAYETLKNPEQRKQYDIYRKHGNSLNKMLENVPYELRKKNYGKEGKMRYANDNLQAVWKGEEKRKEYERTMQTLDLLQRVQNNI